MHMRSGSRLSWLLFAIFLLSALPAAAMKIIEDHQDIEGPFTDGPSVTAVCLECHEDEAHDFMKTSHWTWMPMQDVIGEGEIALGIQVQWEVFMKSWASSSWHSRQTAVTLGVPRG